MVRMKTIKVLEIPPPLLQSQIIVLFTLADDGPTNAYQIAKKTGNRYSLIFKAIKELKKRGMVRFKGKKRTEKRMMANIYDLALKGVLFVLQKELALADTERWNYDFIRKIIRKYDALLPLVFGKWSHFVKMGVEKMALFRLKMIADNPELFERGVVVFDETSPGLEMEQKIERFFYFYGFYPPKPTLESFSFVKDPKVWVSAWKQEEDIKTYTIRELRGYEKKLENLSILVKENISFIEGD